MQVIDPAQGGDQFTSPASGDRFVAVLLKIANTGASTLQDNANVDTNLVGSDNQTYTSALSTVAECTNFDSGDFTLGAGQAATGCVTFQVPTAVSVVGVHFALNDGLDSVTAEWTVP